MCKLFEGPSGRPCNLLPDPHDVPTTPWPGSSPLAAVTVARNTDFDLFYPSIRLPASLPLPMPGPPRSHLRPLALFVPRIRAADDISVSISSLAFLPSYDLYSSSQPSDHPAVSYTRQRRGVQPYLAMLAALLDRTVYFHSTDLLLKRSDSQWHGNGARYDGEGAFRRHARAQGASPTGVCVRLNGDRGRDGRARCSRGEVEGAQAAGKPRDGRGVAQTPRDGHVAGHLEARDCWHGPVSWYPGTGRLCQRSRDGPRRPGVEILPRPYALRGGAVRVRGAE